MLRRLLPCLVAALVFSASLVGEQHAEPPIAGGLSLDEILMRLQIRQWEYERSIPSFFADELVFSEVRGQAVPRIRTVTESTFRLHRSTELGVYPPLLDEARAVRRSSGVTAQPNNALVGPSIVIGAFSSGLATITMQQKGCYDFRLEHHHPEHNVPTFVIFYREKPDAERLGDCLPWRGADGQVLVDANSFHVLQFFMHVPRYPMFANIEGPWRWSIDYQSVPFDGRTFYLPNKIESNAETLDGRIMWSFYATYRNYHKTDVRSRIITNVDAKP